jgi:hypothetical protein
MNYLYLHFTVYAASAGVSNISSKPGDIVGHHKSWTFVNTEMGLQIL